MKRSEIIFGLLRIPMDAFAALAALLLSYRLRLANIDLIPGVKLLDSSPTLPGMEYYMNRFVLPWVLVFILAAAAMKLYSLVTTASSWNEIGRIFL